MATRRHSFQQIGRDAQVQERQRTVIVVATGLALAVVAVTVNRLLADNEGGWFAYAPNTSVTFSPGSDGPIWREAGVWLGAIAAWSVASTEPGQDQVMLSNPRSA